MFRIQCFHEPMPPWKSTRSGPWPRRCTAIRGDVALTRSGERRPPLLAAEPGALRPPRAQLLRWAIDRMPGGAEARRAPQRGLAVTADPDRWMRLLHRSRLEQDVAELRVLAAK